MQKMITLTCYCCNNKFERLLSEHKQNMKKNRKTFCSRSCMCVQHNKTRIPCYNLNNLKRSTTDEFSPFRRFIASMKRRKLKTGKEHNITLQDLKEQWKKQKGICPYTGWQLWLPIAIHKWDPEMPKHLKASIDRINSSKGYIKGNIQFVCLIANLAKNNFSDEDLIKFCNAVVKNNSRSNTSIV